jgi:hypothetical protein
MQSCHDCWVETTVGGKPKPRTPRAALTSGNRMPALDLLIISAGSRRDCTRRNSTVVHSSAEA